MESPNQSYLQSIRKQFLYYKTLAEKAMSQLDPNLWFLQPGPYSNSIAMIVNHMSGNMISRWTDFLTSDGEKPWRQRDLEFEDVLKTESDVTTAWQKGWDCLFNAINPLTEQDLTRTVYIRNEGCTVMDAINRQLAHYPYHIGQIVFYAKMLTTGDWESLSIPKNASKAYNDEKFSQQKAIRHFTDAEIDRLK